MANDGILLVEDEVVIGREIRLYLEDMGYRVCGHATSGKEALDLAKKEKPQIVLMDISLQGELDGIETARLMRTQWNLPNIFLTAHADSATLMRAREVEPFGYLVKPVEPLELRATIEMALKRIQLEKEREELINQLQHALSQVKLLSGLLPICSYCKKIRDDKGYWKQIEGYIQEHSEAKFSHSLCRECAKKHYPDYDIYKD